MQQLLADSKTIAILAIALLFSSISIFAQTSLTVRGTVTDDQGSPLSGASVRFKNGTIGISTDSSGVFTLNVPNGNGTLVFSSVGHAPQEVAIKNRLNITVRLLANENLQNEVIVVGYGTQRKRDVTGAVVSLKPENFNKGASASLNQLISGKAAGVRVVQNSNEPGGGISVNIRGAGSVSAGSDPLYVIDGLPLDNTPPVAGTGRNYVTTNTPRSPLNSINPNDIESIEILKDASATAIYGSRGANGVIMITTKKGKEGAPRLNYSTYVGTQNVINRLRVLNAQEYMDVLNDIIANGGGSASEKVTGIQDGGTDWQDQIYQDNALIQSHNISLSGGSGKSTYFLGANYFDQKGIVVTSGLKRYSVRLNLTSQLSDRVNVGVNMTTSYTEDNFAPEGNGFNELGGTIYSALNMDPTIGIKDANGKYQTSPYITIDNPLALVYGKRASSSMYRTLGTLYGTYRLAKGLTAKLNIGGDVINQRRDVYVDRSTIGGSAANGVASILNGVVSNYLAEGTVSYDKIFGKHRVNAVAGATTQKFITNRNSSEASGFPSDATGTNNIGSGSQSTYSVNSFKVSNRLISYLGRVNYTFADKYLLTTSFRIDGSSRFGNNSKYGYFPSFAAGWKIDKEDFFRNITALSSLKLRSSWGRTGNQSIGDYQSQVTYASGPVGVFNNQLTATQHPARLGNPNLKWETTEQFDIGVDFGVFNNRITGSVDYYNKKTIDMLLNKPVSTTTGFNTQLLNIGSIKNTGWDFTLSTLNLNGNLKWNTDLNFSTIKNKVLDLGGISQISVGSAGVLGQNPAVIMPGEPLYSFYGYKVVGIWQTTDNFKQTKDPVKSGDFKYLDVNGDSVVNASDRVLLGNSFPKFTWSVTNRFSYKKFSLEVFFEGVHGISMYNNNLADVYFPINFRRNKLAEPYLNRWTAKNPSNVYPSFITPLSQGQKLVNSYTVEDASYVRLQTVTLSYQLPPINKVFRSGSLYVTGQNLLILTNYTGMDPSVNPGGNANYRVDFNATPATANLIVGATLDF
ncbi:MAG: TonB-dependent receptor [Segetibacter sp.]